MPDLFNRLKAALADRYAIEEELGAGGMATVYLAEDLKLHRKVAVKVLRPELAAALGPERFLREIEIAAKLHHPHILPLHDSGEADGFLYYVMPYEQGQSLREKLVREGELPVTEAARILRDVVDALSHAHGQGVVHRDIKPDNVMLSGRHALVTDFGVAKAVSEATGREKLTTAGVALGTPAYMAPEQASGDPHIDHRADIYAVGVMAYELLAGRVPFGGPTSQAILSAHITETPEPVTKHRQAVPPALAELVMRCLEKKPADRWQSAEELLLHIEAAATPSGGLTPTATVPVSAVPKKRSAAFTTASVIAVVTVGFFGWSLVRERAPTITLANFRQLTNAPEMEIHPAISPDGREVVYAAGFLPDLHLYVRDLGGGRPIALTADRSGLQFLPRWTPDGSSIAFLDADLAGIRTFLIPRFGGTTQPIGNATVWDLYEDRALVARRGRLFVQPLLGGDSTLIPSETPAHSAVWSPDGKALVFVVGNTMFGNPLAQIGSIAPSAIWTMALGGGEPTMVTGGDGSLNTSPAWMPDGRTVLFVSDRDGPRDVFAIRLDGTLGSRGDPVRVTTGLNPHSITLSADGSTMAFAQLTFRTNIVEIPIPSSGSASITDAQSVTSGNQTVENHGVSLDDRWLAYDSNLEGNQDIYLMPTDGGEARRITTHPGDDFHPDPSPDGSEVVFYSTRFGLRDLFLIAADGTGETRLTDDPRDERHPAFSPDGLAIAFEAAWPQSEVYVITRKAIGAPWSAPRQITTNGGRHPRWSRDGSRILYNTDLDDIGIVTLSGEDRRLFNARTAGFTGAEWPLWSPDGREVYFTSADATGARGLYAVSAVGGTPRPIILFDDPSMQVPFSFSVSSDKIYFSVTEYDSDIFVTEVEMR